MSTASSSASCIISITARAGRSATIAICRTCSSRRQRRKLGLGRALIEAVYREREGGGREPRALAHPRDQRDRPRALRHAGGPARLHPVPQDVLTQRAAVAAGGRGVVGRQLLRARLRRALPFAADPAAAGRSASPPCRGRARSRARGRPRRGLALPRRRCGGKQQDARDHNDFAHVGLLLCAAVYRGSDAKVWLKSRLDTEAEAVVTPGCPVVDSRWS